MILKGRKGGKEAFFGRVSDRRRGRLHCLPFCGEKKGHHALAITVTANYGAVLYCSVQHCSSE